MTNAVNGITPLDTALQNIFNTMVSIKFRDSDDWRDIPLFIMIKADLNTCIISPSKTKEHCLVGNGTNHFVDYQFSLLSNTCNELFVKWFMYIFDVNGLQMNERYRGIIKRHNAIEAHVNRLGDHLNGKFKHCSKEAVSIIGAVIADYFDEIRDLLETIKKEIDTRADEMEAIQAESDAKHALREEQRLAVLGEHAHQGVDGDKTGAPGIEIQPKNIFQAKHQADLNKIKPWWKFWK